MDTTVDTPPRRSGVVFHHIGVQTADLDNCLAWYADFFGAEKSWSLSTFSALTRERLAGIGTLVELAVGTARFHIFDRSGCAARDQLANTVRYQHVCLAVESRAAVHEWRARWIELYESGRYVFALTEPATRVDIDADGVASFYAYDVNGLEFEFTHVPDHVS